MKWEDVIEELRMSAELPTGISVIAAKTAIKAIGEVREYRKLGTPEELREAREKQRAKKQGNIYDSESHFKLSKNGFLCCSVTNKDIRYPLISLRDLDYCPRCGQALDWNT